VFCAAARPVDLHFRTPVLGRISVADKAAPGPANDRSDMEAMLFKNSGHRLCPRHCQFLVVCVSSKGAGIAGDADF
jgi:hypothetical protein